MIKLQGQLSDLSGNFEGLSPQYQQIQGVFNNFQTLHDVNLLSIGGLSAAIDAIKSVIPFQPVPTTSPFIQQMIGYGKMINEQMQQLQAFALDAYGQVMDLYDEAIANMQGVLDDAFNKALDAADFDKLLAEAGIENIGPIGPDGVRLEDISQESFGNMLVDFSTKPLGEVGASLGLVADINSAFNDVKPFFNEGVQLTQNQTVAVSNFIHNIGQENFLNSNVFEAINNNKLERVPHLMQAWVLGSAEPGDPQTNFALSSR